MALLEQLVEAQLAAALSTAVGTLCPVLGFLQPVAEGVVKSQSRTSVLVTCRPRAAVFGSTRITLPVTIDIKVAMEEDPEGALIALIAAPVQTLLDSWNDDPSALRTALNIADVYRADGLLSEGGDAGDDTSNSLWYWTHNLQLKGVRLPPAVETP